MASSLLYVLLIAVLNLNLGFLAAIYVGWRYRTLACADGGDKRRGGWPQGHPVETAEGDAKPVGSISKEPPNDTAASTPLQNP